MRTANKAGVHECSRGKRREQQVDRRSGGAKDEERRAKNEERRSEPGQRFESRVLMKHHFAFKMKAEKRGRTRCENMVAASAIVGRENESARTQIKRLVSLCVSFCSPQASSSYRPALFHLHAYSATYARFLDMHVSAPCKKRLFCGEI